MHSLNVIIALNARPELARTGCSASINLGAAKARPKPTPAPAQPAKAA